MLQRIPPCRACIMEKVELFVWHGQASWMLYVTWGVKLSTQPHHVRAACFQGSPVSLRLKEELRSNLGWRQNAWQRWPGLGVLGLAHEKRCAHGPITSNRFIFHDQILKLTACTTYYMQYTQLDSHSISILLFLFYGPIWSI